MRYFKIGGNKVHLNQKLKLLIISFLITICIFTLTGILEVTEILRAEEITTSGSPESSESLESTTLPEPSGSPEPTPVPSIWGSSSDEELYNNKCISMDVQATTTLYKKGIIGEICIRELYSGSINQGASIRIKLKNPNYRFTKAFEAIYRSGSVCNALKVSLEENDKTLCIVIPSGQVVSGTDLILKNIEVEAISKEIEVGPLKVDLLGEKLQQEKYDIKVADICNPTLKINVGNVSTIDAGNQKRIEFEISENVENYLISRNQISLKLEHGHWDYKGLVQRAAAMKQLTGFDSKKVKEYSDTEYFTFAKKINPYWLAKEMIDETSGLKRSNGTPEQAEKADYCQLQFAPCDSDDIEGCELILTLGKSDSDEALENNHICDKIKVCTKVCIPISEYEEKEMRLSTYYADQSIETKLATINSPFTISIENGSLSLAQNKKQKVEDNIYIVLVPKQKSDEKGTLSQFSMQIASGWKVTKNTMPSHNTDVRPVFTWTLSQVNKALLKAKLTYLLDQNIFSENYEVIIYGKAIDSYCTSEDINDISKAHQIRLSNASQ